MKSSLTQSHPKGPMAASLAPAQVEKPEGIAKIGLLGASGYSGLEFLRLAKRHPGLQVVCLGVREAARRDLAEFFPGGLTGASGPGGAPGLQVIEPEELLAEAANGVIDTIVSALPHGVCKQLLAAMPEWERGIGPRIVDLSGDHRDGAGGFVYGLPELFRNEVRPAHRIANPGCYATAAILALAPAAEAGWLSGPVTVSAISGVTGAGRAATLHTSFAEANENASYYRAGGDHAHIPEIERALGQANLSVAFTPQLVPMNRGILLTAVAPLRQGKSAAKVRELYEGRYASEPFVRVLTSGQWPSTREVRGSNRCDLSVQVQHQGGTLVGLAAIDNLVKGAAGQAMQNLNCMLGWLETTGLPVEATPW
jgi:N-acetyl-gamma-glutamyl-phosphate reductase